MARKAASPRIKELANKIQPDTAPHQIDEAAVTKATTAGNIDDGDSKEFMQFLREIGENGNVSNDDDDGDYADANEDVGQRLVIGTKDINKQLFLSCPEQSGQ